MHLKKKIVKAGELNQQVQKWQTHDKENLFKLTVSQMTCDSVLVSKMKAEV